MAIDRANEQPHQPVPAGPAGPPRPQHQPQHQHQHQPQHQPQHPRQPEWPPPWPTPAGWPTKPPWPPAPRNPTALDRRWPGPRGGAGRAVIGGALITGLVTAISVPLDRPGVGWLVTGIVGVVCLAVVAIRRRTRTGVRGWPAPARLVWAAATLALLAAGILRSAGWLFALCAVTAIGTGSLAATSGRAGGRSTLGMVTGAAAWPMASLRSLPWAFRGGRRLGGPEIRVGLTVAVTALLVLVFGALFAGADAAFDRFFSAVVPDLDADTVTRWIFLFPVGALALLGVAYLLARPPDLGGLDRPGNRGLRRFEWGLPIVALDLLFAAFVAVQFTVLFGGRAHVLGPNGPNYADYARGGFWQLLTVTILTLLVLGAAARWARRDRPIDRVLIRVLLGTLAALTLVIVVSALYRMHVYEQAYGFTRLRVLVSACELWLGVLFLLVLAAGVRLRGAWLPRAAVGSAVMALLGLVALDPDRFIADRNVDRYTEIGRIDTYYLSTLSVDAVPALDRLPGDLRDCVLSRIDRRLDRLPDDDWYEANLARARARAILDRDPAAGVELGVRPCEWDRW
jgi:hypothetical protein